VNISHFRQSALAAATLLALAGPAAAQGRVDLSGLATADTHDRFIVKYRDGSTAVASTSSLQRSLDQAARSLPLRGGTRAGIRHLRRMAVGAEVVQVGRKLDRVEAETLMRQFAADPNVEYVEVDALHRIAAVPNDPNYNGGTNKQWHYFESTGGMNLPQAWDKSTGTGIVVAVVDSGYLSHNDLNGNKVGGYDFVSAVGTGQGQSNDGNGRDSDPTDASNVQHGTHVAGTIAAVTNNNLGVAGVAYGAKYVPIRVLGQQGYGSTSDIADGIVWASGGSVSGVPANQYPADVINLSLGGSGSCSSSYQSAVNTAVQNGAVVVVAAGNNNANVSGFTPANCNNVIAVAANDREGNRASYSNYGTLIDVTAPGGETATSTNGVLSTVASNGYAFYQGTSMATPHVAGLVALIQSAAGSNPKTPAQIEQILKDTARPLPGSCSGGCGAGITDAKAAVDAVTGGGGGAPTAAFSQSVNGLTVSFSDQSTDSGGSIASRSWDFGDGTTSTQANPSKTYSAAGTYSVKLTVTDNEGNTDDETKSVTVGAASNKLTNGTPVTGLSGAAGASLRYTMDVPAGATNLRFVTASGSGDPDLYAKFGSEPTTTSSDCKSEASSTTETCTITTAQAGTYHVLVYGYSQFSGVSLTGSYSTGGGGTQTYTNTADYAINDLATVESPIAVSGRSGNAPTNSSVAVNIVHTFRGDVQLDLVAPDGSTYRLKNISTTDSADNINASYTVNLGTEALNGTWKLRAYDSYANDTGYINSWSITF
jgi:serine protease